MPLSNEQAALLAAELTDAAYEGTTDAEASDLANVPATVTTTVTRPKPFTRQQILACLDATALGNVMALPIALKIIDALNASDHQAVGEYVASLAGNSKITPDQATAINAILTQTIQVTTTSLGPTPFQAIVGLGDAAIQHNDGSLTVGTCHPWMVTQARSN